MAKNNIRYHKVREVGKISKEGYMNMVSQFLEKNPTNKLNTEAEFKEFWLHLQQDGITPGHLSEEAKGIFFNKLKATTPKHVSNKPKSFIERFRK